MSLTEYQAKYFAHELTRRFPSDSVEKLTAALVDAQVDLNPHRIYAALTLEAKLAGQRQIKALEAQRNQKRRSLFDAQDEVDRQREELIARVEDRLNQRTSHNEVFRIRWMIVLEETT